MTEEDADAAFEATMELTQLKAGDVVTDADADAIQRLFADYSEEVERGASAYAEGEKAGREQAGGAEVAKLLETIDTLKLQLVVERSLKDYYAAMWQRERS